MNKNCKFELIDKANVKTKTNVMLRIRNYFLLFVMSIFLSACEIDLYQGLSEKEANTMLATLLKNGISASKVSAGKAGFTVLVDESKLVQALDILNNNNLPGDTYENLGTIFSGESMIASASEENARMAYAISQELSDTISRMDGVLTSRVHIVLGVKNQANEVVTEPSASIFIRHTPDSTISNYIPQLRDMAAKSVPDLSPDSISITLMPAREVVSIPMVESPSILEIVLQSTGNSLYILILLGITGLGALVYLIRVVLILLTPKKVEKTDEYES